MAIWNEFQMIGYALTNWERIETSNGFAFRQMKLEITNNGYTDTFSIKCYEKGARIDFTKEIKGRLVMISGYLKSYKSKEHENYDPIVWQVADNMMIMEKGFKDSARVPKQTSYQADNVKKVDMGKAVEQEAPEEAALNVVEDDELPF